MTFSYPFRPYILALAILPLLLHAGSQAVAQRADSIGLFEAQGDVGDNPRKGSASYHAATSEYRVTGGGSNMWGPKDAFHFVWKRANGNFAITADVHFTGKGAEDHRKAVLAVRQSLDPNAAYADVALHGDGLTALQFRPIPGAETSEVRSSVNAPIRIRIERRGAQFLMSAGKPGEVLAGAAPATVSLEGPVYIGIGVCSHDAQVLETAVFSNVSIQELPATESHANPENVRSKISIYDLESKSVRVAYTADKLWEAPNWSSDGKYLLANSGGAIYRFMLDTKGEGQPEKLALDKAYDCNNDKALSPDGKRLAFSAQHAPAKGSQVYVSKADGTSPQMVTANIPSYFHGWSPDGRWLAFVGERGGNFDIYRVSSTGGKEERLTSSPGFDDGPDYSPDGKWIYINTDRSGGWDIWRFPAEGAGANDIKAERVTRDAGEDWFPHPSPDGKRLVFLTFPAGTKGHDFKTAVRLRMIPLPSSDAAAQLPKDDDDNAIPVLTQFFGGQGSINVNSWSPDSKKFAFVSYELLP
jgi:dipeptidyl aminopeptidase/acylaminoacyl peptidase